jgi:hypothetical protein
MECFRNQPWSIAQRLPMNRVACSSLPSSYLLILAAAILPATGCTRSLDMAALDRSISDGINTQLQVGRK